MIYKATFTAMRGERCDTMSLSLNEHGKKDKRILFQYLVRSLESLLVFSTKYPLH